MLKTGLVLSSKVATDWFLAMKRYPFLLSQIPSVILEKKCWLKKCIQGDSLKSQAVFLLHSFCNETSSRNFMCAFCHNLRRAIEIIAWKLVSPSPSYLHVLYNRVIAFKKLDRRKHAIWSYKRKAIKINLKIRSRPTRFTTIFLFQFSFIR